MSDALLPDVGHVPAVSSVSVHVSRTTEVRAIAAVDEPGRSAFDLVYVEQRPPLVRLATLLVRSQPVAEEIVQEAFVRLFERFDSVDNPPAFLRTVTVRLASTWRSRHHMEGERLRLVPPALSTAMAEPDETWEAIGRLRPERATVLLLRFYEDLTHDEIARILGCPTATVRSRVRRGLVDLRKELEP
jgi:RNA polymerase sigma factor (sigma-70 family)